ncbi:G-protein alpha subunit [Fomitopsis serialis]|uniref:G-protein alpha subunit n=1 Tax=Fomitopsis serialis TaxID=139415 RepID=UPI0020085BCE|nr:G-protein alpha subunit [Neoantrodia serialis]KAH9932360.1 G-protein alpha subunit [Neoantrodia serialis]
MAKSRFSPSKFSINEDPLDAVLRPPPDETPDARADRLRREAEAKQVSDEIDESLRQEKAVWKKNKSLFRLLLLGQSESGKSTTLKNFQLTFAPQAWAAERASWRAVVQLNLVHSINLILDVLAQELTANPLQRPRTGAYPYTTSTAAAHTALSTPPSPDSPTGPSFADDVPDISAPLKFTDKHALLKLRLAPLRHVETDLRRLLGAADDATEVIAGCREDMKTLWEDGVVREMLTRLRLRMEDSAGFFLDDVDRIATRTYEPSDDDVVRARLRTVGVQEYQLRFENPGAVDRSVGREWIIYDVGGARSSRAAWVPYFEDANALLFLTPISCFDESLEEDRHVNRLEDSFILWKSVVGSKLLRRCIIVLFLNKYDLLAKKLKAGATINKHLSSYGERENTAPVFAKYLHQKFREQHKEYSPEPRSFYGYVTCVIDTKATASTLSSVRDGLLQQHLQRADLVA